MNSPRRILLGTILAVGLPVAGASAAPQVLGVMASVQPVPLVCLDGQCRAEVTAFCLQESRPVPSEGTAYQALGSDQLALVLKRADGGEVRLPAEAAAISSSRGFTAVSISVPETLLQRHGAVAAEVEVLAGATVAPVPVAGDPAPQSAEEIALAAGPMRRLAADRLEQGPTGDAARLVERLISALPPKDRETPAVRDGLWDVAIGPTIEAASDPEGAAMARLAYDGCRAALGTGYVPNLRHCLERGHGEMMIERTHAFWREAGAGS
jgi:hypothetical protein